MLTYTAQGFGDSSGCVTLQRRTYDVKDAQQLITQVLDPRPDVLHDANGSVVGMVGGSYGGGIQLNLAESDPRIHAISPGRTWNSLQYSLDPNNRVVPGDPTGFSHTLNEQGVFKAQWTSLFFASGNTQPAPAAPATLPAGQAGQRRPARGRRAAVPRLPRRGLPHLRRRLLATGDATDADRALLADASGATADRPAARADAARAGAGRHAVQPQRRRRHLHGAAAQRRAGEDDLELRRARRLRLAARRVRGLRPRHRRRATSAASTTAT